MLLRLVLCTFASAALQATTALAGDCGDRFAGDTIHWIVPSSPGGGYDTYSRLVAPYYEKHTGAHVVVQNRPGAGGRIGATRIMDADSDGRTIGILNGPGLMMASLFDDTPTPNPATDFTILGRVASSRHVWAVAANSELPPLKTILEEGQARPIVFGTRGPGTLSFVDIVIVSSILGLDTDIVTGFKGSQDGTLGILRGDVDAVAHSHGSLAAAFDSKELKPWLQISDGPLDASNGLGLENIPWLAGEDGVAALAAKVQGRDVDRVVARANALVELTRAGRLIVAPPGLEEELKQCMRDTLHAVLTNEQFLAAAGEANLYLDVARGEEAGDRLQAVQPDVVGFAPELRQASEKYGK